MKTCIYLRKSRQDEELEKKEDADTLSRHRSTLLAIARKQNLDIVEIKEEIVSGGSISSRPKMLQLLDEVKNNMYDAVLCMDLDRLGRGGMQDQGLILDTFKESHTLIITPDKTYDLNNEYDEEMTEFKSFFARRELKMITKRMARGRIKSVEEGNFIASYAPFGYKFNYNENGIRELVIDTDKAIIIKEIFSLYINGYGTYKIKTYLDSIGAVTNNGIPFTEQAIRRIIKNKTYCGYITWNKFYRKGKTTKRQPAENIIISKGKHEPIISEELFNIAKEIMESRVNTSTGHNKKLINPLAGIIKCSCCGRNMVSSRTNSKNGYTLYIKCNNCKKNGSSKLEILENDIINYLEEFLYEYKENLLKKDIKNNNNDRVNNLKHNLNLLLKESEELNRQKNNLHDLLERGIYDLETYLDRTNILSKKTDDNIKAIENTKKSIKNELRVNLSYDELIPKISKVVLNYKKTDDTKLKNFLLKSIIEEVIFFKERGYRNGKIEIDIKLKLPNI